MLLVVVAIAGLFGMWLLVSTSARRSLLVERGGVELRRRRGLAEALDARLMRGPAWRGPRRPSSARPALS